jgi:hypothetical protein
MNRFDTISEMGVIDLPKILKAARESEGHLNMLSGLTMAVDIECWFHKAVSLQAYYQSYHMVPPVPLTEISQIVLKLHTLLISFKIKPVYVIGGKKHIVKKDVDDARAASIALSLNELNLALEKDVDIGLQHQKNTLIV